MVVVVEHAMLFIQIMVDKFSGSTGKLEEINRIKTITQKNTTIKSNTTLKKLRNFKTRIICKN